MILVGRLVFLATALSGKPSGNREQIQEGAGSNPDVALIQFAEDLLSSIEN